MRPVVKSKLVGGECPFCGTLIDLEVTLSFVNVRAPNYGRQTAVNVRRTNSVIHPCIAPMAAS